MNQILVCFFVGLAIASASAADPISIVMDTFKSNIIPTQTFLDSRMDDALVMVGDMMNALVMPDTTVPVQLGQMNLTEVKFYGFNSIRRNGDVAVTYNDNLIDLELPLAYKYLTIVSKYTPSNFLLGSPGNYTATVDKLLASCSFFIDRSTFKVHLQNFKINNIGAIGVKFNGTTLIDWVVNLFTSAVYNLFKVQIKTIIGPHLKQLLEELVAKYNAGVDA